VTDNRPAELGFQVNDKDAAILQIVGPFIMEPGIAVIAPGFGQSLPDPLGRGSIEVR
jgi:hypothetical protein